ncbi:MAG: RNA polymerase sigma factor [Thermoanaerobaculia bacterium]|nr:RNA polymerase sigma factor [Thermoanaerobaculia bacterium]
MRGDSDESLALSVYRREDGAFEELIATYEKPLFNYVHRLLFNAHDAEEVVQDTFIRAHKALTRKYTEQQCRDLRIRAWLFRIARNLSRNKRRGKRHELEQQMSESGSEVETVSPLSIVCEVEKKEDLERLEMAIRKLPRETRELIVLRFIEEMSYAEIAETTGSTESSLRGKIFRSLRALRDALSSEEVAHAM